MNLDHVNIRTAQLARMVRFYCDVLGLRAGPRPPFPFGGAWLYAGDAAVVHLVETARQPAARDPAIEHFALNSSGLRMFLAHLAAHDIPTDIARVPGYGTVQVNLRDPDGNHIHIDFGKDEDPGGELPAR